MMKATSRLNLLQRVSAWLLSILLPVGAYANAYKSFQCDFHLSILLYISLGVDRARE